MEPIWSGALVRISQRAALVTRRLVSYSNFLEEATPIGLSLLAIYALSQADLWVCGVLLPREDVAIYGIAQRISAIVSMPLLIFGAVVTPTIAELLAKKDFARLKLVMVRGNLIVFLCALGALCLGALLGWPVIRFIIGANYVAAYPLFFILALGHVAYAAIGANGYLLLLSGEQQSVMASTIIATVALFALALPGGYLWGTKGIALASSCALFLQSILMLIAARRRLKMDLRFHLSDLRKPPTEPPTEQ